MQVTVPAGVSAGQTIQVDMAGQLVQVQVPPGLQPGQRYRDLGLELR